MIDSSCDEVNRHSTRRCISEAIYALPPSTDAGSNLGVSFERSQLEEIEIIAGAHAFVVMQSGMGCMGIAGCVWNCAYYCVDYLSHLFHDKFDFGDMICDLATGTGVVGSAYILLNMSSVRAQTTVVFTDKTLTSSFYDNIDEVRDVLKQSDKGTQTSIKCVEFDWLDTALPEEMSTHFTTILCSDAVYLPAVSRALLSLLRRVSFDRMILAYKRRSDSKEKFFFEELETFCTVSLVAAGDPCTICCIAEFPLINICKADTTGMYILLIEPKQLKC